VVNRGRDDGESGFTLLELLIALVLLAVIAAVLVAAVGSARQALVAVDRRGAQAAVPAVQGVLRRLIREARPGPQSPLPPEANRAFVGEPDRLSFVSSFVPQGQYGGLRRYDIFLDPAGAGSSQLVIDQRLRLAPTMPMPLGETRTVLIDDVESLRVRYFGALEQDGAPTWHDSWRHPAGLPLLVSVDITFSRGDRRQWVTLVAGPALAR
jgi:general secretion pathway protein J